MEINALYLWNFRSRSKLVILFTIVNPPTAILLWYIRRRLLRRSTTRHEAKKVERCLNNVYFSGIIITFLLVVLSCSFIVMEETYRNKNTQSSTVNRTLYYYNPQFNSMARDTIDGKEPYNPDVVETKSGANCMCIMKRNIKEFCLTHLKNTTTSL